jgi:hypothetical protein
MLIHFAESDIILKDSSPLLSLLLRELPPDSHTRNFTFVFYLSVLFYYFIYLFFVGHARAPISYTYIGPRQVMSSCFCNFGHSVASFAIKQLLFLLFLSSATSFLPSDLQGKIVQYTDVKDAT